MAGTGENDSKEETWIVDHTLYAEAGLVAGVRIYKVATV